MPAKTLILLLLVSLVSARGSLEAQEKKDNTVAPFGASRVKVYKTIGDVKLRMRIYSPPGHRARDRKAAVVFFFGGGWTGGSPRQFQNQAAYLASRGMVAMTADYRVRSRHGVNVVQCVADAKSAMRWAREHADKLGIDPSRIAAGGGSAGGHLAAAVGTLKGFDETGEDTSISSRPNAMLLFNPALDLRAEAFGLDPGSERALELAARWGTEPENLSPGQHVKSGLPPTIIFHGKADTTVPYAQSEKFTELMKEAGNRCELAGFDGQAHGFFNFGRDKNAQFIATVGKMDGFLVSLGYLEGKSTVEQFVKDLE